MSSRTEIWMGAYSESLSGGVIEKIPHYSCNEDTAAAHMLAGMCVSYDSVWSV